tara:strand:- start:325 stop:474 length:150 start_codon:yes stop_codon:yes gene_type:complete
LVRCILELTEDEINYMLKKSEKEGIADWFKKYEEYEKKKYKEHQEKQKV